MSITTGMGRRIVCGERRRLKKKEEVEDRSRLIYERLCEGDDPATVGRLYRISERHVYRLVSRMPAALKLAIRRDVARRRRERLEDMAERLGAN